MKARSKSSGGFEARQRLADHRLFLQTLLNGSPEFYRYSLQNLSPDQARLLQDIIRNFIRGNIKIPDTEFHKLSTHRHILTSLCQKRLSKKRLIPLLRQVGGGILPILVTALASLLGGFLR